MTDIPDEAVEAAQAAWTKAYWTEATPGRTDWMRAALEAAYPMLPKVMLDRPVPTREAIDALLQLWHVGPAYRPLDPSRPGALRNYRRKLRNALLELLNGDGE